MKTQQTNRNRTEAARGRSLTTVLASVAFAGLFLPAACGAYDSEPSVTPGDRQAAERDISTFESFRPEPVPVPEPRATPAPGATPAPAPAFGSGDTEFLLGQREPAQQEERHA